MRLAVLSDIHANLEALDAVLAHARGRGATDFACLGDVVGYGADPAACIDRIRSLPLLAAICGNHDAMVATGAIDPYTNRRAVLAVAWTREVLSPDHLAWLRDLPLQQQIGDDVCLVHDSPAAPGSWSYITDERGGETALAAQTAHVCFFGHTHQPLVLRQGAGVVPLRAGGVLALDPAARYLINCGSVGQPRDGDPRAAYGIYDREARTVEQYRVVYDIAAAQTRILDVGLPEMLAERLAMGR